MLDKNISDIKESRINFIDNISYQLMTFVIFVLSLLPLAFFIWSNQKGFGTLDEGFYLLSSQYPLEVKILPSMAHIYTGWMYYLVGQNIITFRFFGELLLVGSASIFFWGWYRLVVLFYPQIRTSLNIKVIAWSSISLGALLYYTFFLVTPSYNLLNAIALNITIGFLCFSLANLSETPINLKRALVNFFAAGLFVGAALVIKFPTAVTITFLYVFILLLWPNLDRKVRWASISMLGVGITAWVFFHVFYFQSWHLLWHGIYDGVAAGVFDSSGHGLVVNLLRYPRESFHLIIISFQNFWIFYFIVTLMFFFSYKVFNGVKSTKFFSSFFVVLFSLIGCYCFKSKFYKGGWDYHLNLTQFYVAWLLLLTISVLLNIIYQKKLIENWKNITGKRIFLICMLFLALPYVGMMGTANLITKNLIINIASWMGLIQCLLLSLSFSYNSRWVVLVGTFIINVFACTQIISSGFCSPFNLHKNLLYQTVSTPIGFPPTYLKIDKEGSKFFNQLYQIALSHGFKPGDDILAFSNMPGLVFTLGGKSPVIPFFNNYPNSNKVNEWFLDHTTPQRIKKAFILQNASGERGFPNLAKYGIKFPDDYILCGQLVWLDGDWVRLWKPKVLN